MTNSKDENTQQKDSMAIALERIEEVRRTLAMELDLSELSLTAVPATLGQLEQLRTLNLSDNQLTAVPVTLGQLRQLQVLNLHNNQLTQVPAALKQLEQLQTLSLYNNQLTAVPEWIGELQQLRMLDFSNNQLTEVPATLGQLQQLEMLSLSSNQLTRVLEMLWTLTQLQILDLSNNQLTAVPEWIGELQQLWTLDLFDNQLTEVSEWIGQLEQLRTLNLSKNQLTAVPATLGQLEQLRTLNLSDNQLTAVPVTLGQLRQLQVLNLHNNQLTQVPAALKQLEQLQTLSLYNNQLTAVPEWIGELQQLRTLYLYSNQLTEVPATLGQLQQMETLSLSSNQLVEIPVLLGELQQLRTLYLYNNQLTRVPAVLGQLPYLQEIYLHNNRLTRIPATFGQLEQLRTLSLHNNELAEVPVALGELRQLRTLNLSNNKLAEVPVALGDLQQLQTLDLHNNRLTRIPATLGQLEQLQILNLSNNELTEVPATLGRLQQLRTLNLSENQLVEIPAALGELQQLRTLNLSENQLTCLPEALKELASLTQIYLHANEQLGLPAEILGPPLRLLSAENRPADPQTIFEYYFRAQSGRPLNEAKLILVGRGGVGKTSLVNQLVHSHFDRNEEKTEGIQITEWKRLLNGNEDIRLNVWDFGGQEIMHATHQFFLTQRSLYLLVLNGREGGEDADAEYWLKLIESFGGDSPVIVVLNKIRQHPFDLNYRALQQKYPNIREFVRTDCEDVRSIEELRKVIDRETDRLKHLRDRFPANWFEIKDHLAQMQENYLEFEKYCECCASFGETNDVTQKLLAGYLHQLGIVLNYKDDPRLQDTHVLNPHWVTTGIYKILNSEKLARQKGQIYLNDVDTILDPKDYPSKMRRFIFDLMKKFDLCFSFPDDECHYLVPELLDKQEPEETTSFDPEACLNFQYHYPILPEGLLPRFIVRTHHLSEELPRWRTGVILEFEGHRALVKADVQDKKVLISVSGSREGRRRLLTLIRIEFDSIHRSIRNLQPQEMVPLPEHPAVVVPYRKLLVMEEKGVKGFTEVVADDVIELDVQELLNGVDLARTRRRERTMEGKTEAVRVFYSYSRKDEQLSKELETHLKLLHRQGLIESWKDRQIEGGEEWKDKIDENLERADIILLLISSDFIASDYCYEKEMMRALEKHEDGSARVIPVILRTCNWYNAPFGKLQALPRDAKPITTWSDRDTAWADAASGIERVVETLQKKRRG